MVTCPLPPCASLLPPLQLLLTRSLSSLPLSPSRPSRPRLAITMASGFSAPQNGSVQHGLSNGHASAGARLNAATGGTESSSPRTLTALGRWSILDKKLPPIHTINAVHVYDFDNTRTWFGFWILSSLVSPLLSEAFLLACLLRCACADPLRSIPDSPPKSQTMEHPHPGQAREPRHLRQRRLVA